MRRVPSRRSASSIQAIDRAIESTLLVARDLGCFDLNSDGTQFKHVCDWSYQDFVDELKTTYDNAREAAHSACLETAVNPDDFTDVGDFEVIGLDSIRGMEARSAQGVERFLKRVTAVRSNPQVIFVFWKRRVASMQQGKLASEGFEHGLLEQANGTVDDGSNSSDGPLFSMRLDRRHGYSAGVDWAAIKATAVIDEKDSPLKGTNRWGGVGPDNVAFYAPKLEQLAPDSPGDVWNLLKSTVTADFYLHPIDNIAKHFGKNEVAFERVTGKTAQLYCMRGMLYAGPENFALVKDRDPYHLFDDDLIAYQGTTAAPEWDEYRITPAECLANSKADAYGFGALKAGAFGEDVVDIMDVYVGAGAAMQLDWDSVEVQTYFGADLRVLERSVYTVGSLGGAEPDMRDLEQANDLNELREAMKTAPTETTDAQTSLADVAWNKRQTLATYEQTFVVAAIPVTVEAGITGGLGMDLKPSFGFVNQELADDDAGHVYLVSATLALSPWADLEAYASAAVGVPGLKAGVRGKLVIVKTAVPFSATVRTGAANVDTSASLLEKLDNAYWYLDFGSKVDVELEALSGELEVFAEIIAADYAKTLASWPGYVTERTIWDYQSKGVNMGRELVDAALWVESSF